MLPRWICQCNYQKSRLSGRLKTNKNLTPFSPTHCFPFSIYLPFPYATNCTGFLSVLSFTARLASFSFWGAKHFLCTFPHLWLPVYMLVFFILFSPCLCLCFFVSPWMPSRSLHLGGSTGSDFWKTWLFPVSAVVPLLAVSVLKHYSGGTEVFEKTPPITIPSLL